MVVEPRSEGESSSADAMVRDGLIPAVPRYGISLAGLRHFVEEDMDEDELEGLTTEEVCHRHIMTMTDKDST